MRALLLCLVLGVESFLFAQSELTSDHFPYEEFDKELANQSSELKKKTEAQLKATSFQSQPKLWIILKAYNTLSSELTEKVEDQIIQLTGLLKDYPDLSWVHVKLLMKLGAIYAEQYKTDEAISVQEQGLKIAERSGQKQLFAFALYEISFTYGSVIQNYKKNLEIKKKFLQLYQEIPKDSLYHEFIAHLGFTYVESGLGEEEQGLALLEEAIRSRAKQSRLTHAARGALDLAHLFL